jgi:acetyl esterase/lipase
VSEVTTTTRLSEVMGFDEFAGYGSLLFPSGRRITRDMTVADTARLLPYHSNIRPAEVADTLNGMRADAGRGSLSFHRLYNVREIARDPGKADVGVFFFRGRRDAPLAVVSPGGGFAYVGLIHEGFPYARAITAQGYNSFVLTYRTGGGGRPAMEDLARAIDYIIDNHVGLGVSTADFSLWGSSAGARMAANLGAYGAAAFGGRDRQRPGAVVMAYTGHSDTGGDPPPTFAVVGAHDGIADPAAVESRIRRLERRGVATEFRRYPRLGHGFGLGTGTVAEGWVDDAVDFWEAHTVG